MKASPKIPRWSRELGEAGRPRLPGRGPGQIRWRVLACAKHYIGDGGTAFGSRAGRESGSTRAIRGSTKRPCAAFTCPGYIAAIKAGRRHHHAFLQQLERREVLGQQAIC